MLLARDGERWIGTPPRSGAPERRAPLIEPGASRRLKSRHLMGHAVHLAYRQDGSDGTPETGEIRWDRPLCSHATAAMKVAARVEGVKIVWGSDWPSLRGGPHFELDRKAYSA
jgi:peptidoglycan L-alanyl-D-glutamate endopeptidase CwlK